MPPVDRRKIGLFAAGALICAIAWQTPTARLHIATHDGSDMTPQRLEAAVDLGITAVSLLVTWSKRS